MDDIGPLKRFRISSGMSHAEMLAELNIDRGTLSRIDSGKRWPSRELAERIVALTQGSVTPADFMKATAVGVPEQGAAA